MNMVCCGRIVDTIIRSDNEFKLLVDLGNDIISKYYQKIIYCPFCGHKLEQAVVTARILKVPIIWK